MGFVDSTKLEMGDSNRWIKAMGPFLGLKRHVLLREDGFLSAFEITQGSVNDKDPWVKGLFKGQSGVVLGDSGYVSQALYWTMRAQHLRLMVKPIKTMGHYQVQWRHQKLGLESLIFMTSLVAEKWEKENPGMKVLPNGDFWDLIRKHQKSTRFEQEKLRWEKSIAKESKLKGLWVDGAKTVI